MDKKIIDKIRKCLALARSGNENEAASALAKARELMDAHGVRERDLELADIEEATARAGRAKRPPLWETVLSNTVCKALQVTCFLDESGDRTFVGRGASAEVASYAFAVLFRKLKTARAAYITAHLKRCKPARKRARADAFCEAWAAAVYVKIQSLFPDQHEDEVVARYIAQRHPTLVPVGCRRSSAQGAAAGRDRLRGVVAGRDVDLNAGLEGDTVQPLALT
ncbi:MAG: hypothetical protein CML67_06575 [Rhodobacteraceae bacterium]|nr:hypothetical protein [Paracoccaceae bacterium]